MLTQLGRKEAAKGPNVLHKLCKSIKSDPFLLAAPSQSHPPLMD